jgi:Tfp pilus assembly protein PilO
MKLFLPFIIITICIGMYFLYISPTLAEISALRIQAADYANVLEKSKELIDKRNSARAAFDSISPDNISRLEKVIPETFDPVLFANDINVMAVRNGLVIRDLKLNDSTEKNRSLAGQSGESVPQPSSASYKTYTVSLVLKGEYGNFRSFLRDLESSLRIIDTNRLSIRPGTQRGKEASLSSFEMEVRTYSLK